MKYEYENVCVKKADYEDINSIMKIIMQKAQWLRDKGIKQWESFFERDISYYQEKIKNGILWVATIDDVICGTFVLQYSDNYWEDSDQSIYIHHLATDFGYKGLGKQIIKKIKIIAQKENKKFIRIDHLKENKKLGYYYEELGFYVVKEIEDKNYNCLLREIKLE